MSYVVLARKYRPQTFRDVVGQDPVSQTLLNALESGRVAHAYVFSGPRGVGKTTTARILAKCLNCAQGVSITPCDKCPSCLSIAQGTSVDDVLEIDGASNRGIEQIRELRESAKYTPASSRYRIFIIDEAHQITKDAFGALLKILEEPPAHVVFMMATTEVHKIPAPILSRCQRFSLRPIAPEEVLAHLKKICVAEKIKADEAALADIVRFVEGSMRDALSLLDQALVFAPEKITPQTLRDLLGLLPSDAVRRFAETINAGKPEDILKMVQAFLQDGIDLTQLGKDLQLHYHDLLLAKAGVKPALTSGAGSLEKEAAGYDFGTLERNIRLLSRALEDMRRSETPRAVFDTYALRLGQKTMDPRDLIGRLEKLEKSGGGFARPSSPVSPPPVIVKSVATTPSTFVSKIETTVEKSPSLPPEPVNGRGADLENWDAWLHDVNQIRSALVSSLEEAKPSLIGKTLLLTFSKSFHEQMVMRALEILKPSLAKHFGADISLQTKLVENTAPAATAPLKPSFENAAPAPVAVENLQSNWEEVKNEAVGADIQKAMKHFPGGLKREKPA